MTATTYQIQRNWSDQFIPDIKRIVGPLLMETADFEDDVRRNTDLVVLRMDATRIMARVRRNQFLRRYPNDITIRLKPDQYGESEFTKLMDGWGDYLFYGFAHATRPKVESWIFGDLQVLRDWINEQVKGGDAEQVNHQTNTDGTHFLTVDHRNVPGFVLHGSGEAIGEPF